MNHGRWYLVSRGMFKKPDGLYHWIDPQTQRSACGWDAYGKHVSPYQSYSQRSKLRCPECVAARKAES